MATGIHLAIKEQTTTTLRSSREEKNKWQSELD